MLLRLRTCSVDLVRGIVAREGEEPERLTSREAALLRYLAARPGQVVSREELLLEVWGYAERVVSRAVDKVVTRLRARIEQDRGAPDHLLTEYGVGFRLVLTAEAALPPLSATAPAPKPADLPGRVEASEALRAALWGADPVISVVGPCGIGKSRLVAAALPEAEAMLDAQVLTAAALDMAVRAQLSAGAAVVVIDGAEAHREALVEQIPRWLREGSVKLVLTSQVPLLLRAERVLRLGPLAPGAAAAMLCERAGRYHPGWGTGPDEAAAVDALCALCGGWPLAIEHLALRARLLSAAALAGRSPEECLPLDSTGPADLPARHRDLRVALEAPLQNLDAVAQQVAVQLAVFAGGATLEAVQAIVTVPAGVDRVGVLAGLSDWGLLWVSEDAEEPRLELPPLLRRLLRSRLDAGPEGRATRDRHLAFFAARGGPSSEAELYRAGGPDRVRQLQLEQADLEVAMHHALDTGRPVEAARCGVMLLSLCARRFDVACGVQVSAALAPILPRLTEPALRLEVRLWLADVQARAGDLSGGWEAMRSIREEAAALGLWQTEADACFGLEMIAVWGWRPSDGQFLEAALRLRRAHGGPTALVLQELGWLWADAAHLPGRAERARALLEEARRAALQEGNLLSEGMVAWGLASLSLTTRAPERAWALSEEARPILVEMGRSTTELRELQGRIALAQGDATRARALLQIAVRGREREGGFRLARSLGYLAEACLADGDLEAARSLIEQAERSARQSSRAELVQILYQRGRVLVALGEAADARRAWDEAETLDPPPFARIDALRSALAADLQAKG